MIKKITSISALKNALLEGVVALVFPDADGVEKYLVITNHDGLIGSAIKRYNSHLDVENAISELRQADSEAENGCFYAFDIVNLEPVEVKPHLFEGTAIFVASTKPYSGPIRNGGKEIQRDQLVDIVGKDDQFTGTVVYINDGNDDQRYTVIIDVDGKSKSVFFGKDLVSEDGENRIKLSSDEGMVSFWRYCDGWDYSPVIDLSSDGLDAAYPLIFVIGQGEDSKTIATNRDGFDEKGNRVFEKVKLDMLPVECEQYLLMNESSVDFISKEVYMKFGAPANSLALPVLAYIRGFSIEHVTLLAN